MVEPSGELWVGGLEGLEGGDVGLGGGGAVTKGAKGEDTGQRSCSALLFGVIVSKLDQ